MLHYVLNRCPLGQYLLDDLKCPCLLLIHAFEYQAYCSRCRWAEGDLHEWSALSYPDALHAYAEAEFEKMKQMQADLLGIKDGPRAKL